MRRTWALPIALSLLLPLPLVTAIGRGGTLDWVVLGAHLTVLFVMIGLRLYRRNGSAMSAKTVQAAVCRPSTQSPPP